LWLEDGHEGKVEGDGLHEYISGKTAIMLKKRPGSERVGYDLNNAKIPSKRKVAKSGSYLRG
jgi:hypothetical protein